MSIKNFDKTVLVPGIFVIVIGDKKDDVFIAKDIKVMGEMKMKMDRSMGGRGWRFFIDYI